MAKKTPASPAAKPVTMPFFHSDWVSSTKVGEMDAIQERAYLRLLCHCWASPNCSLPSSDELLRRIAHWPPAPRGNAPFGPEGAEGWLLFGSGVASAFWFGRWFLDWRGKTGGSMLGRPCETALSRIRTSRRGSLTPSCSASGGVARTGFVSLVLVGRKARRRGGTRRPLQPSPEPKPEAPSEPKAEATPEASPEPTTKLPYPYPYPYLITLC